jgi:acetyl-CoA acetyltransferase
VVFDRRGKSRGHHCLTPSPSPVLLKGRGGDTLVKADEGPGKVKLDKIPSLKPAFRKEGGTITAASSSSINDGAALVMTTQSTVKKVDAKPIARTLGMPPTRSSPSGSRPPRSAPWPNSSRTPDGA